MEKLRELGFVGSEWPVSGGTGYLLGEQFFQFITFMGCAPAIKLEPTGPGDEAFCHIRISAVAEPRFLYLRGERPARCPVCRKPGITATEYAQQQLMAAADWHCPACQNKVLTQQLDWRREAGQACFMLEVKDIYPHEGIPTDFLLEQLRDMTQQTWSYFYA